jgi:hypothetical protein
MSQPNKETRPTPDHLPHKDNVAKLDASSDIVHVRNSILSRLAEDDCESIRRSVAENPRTPPEMLKRLSSDPGIEVRLAVAENPNTQPEVLSILAEDHAVDVRFGVAENPHMPEDILLKLAQDENPYIRCRALKTVQMLAPDAQSRLTFQLLQNSI